MTATMGGRVPAVVSVAVMAAVVLSSCAKSQDVADPADGGIAKVFHAGNSPVTRTALTEDNAVLWERGDAIAVFDESGARNRFSTGDSGVSASFSGTVSVEGSYYALYPYDESAEIEGSVISTVLPAVQTAKAGSFASGLNPSVAKADENDMLYFRNACPIVKFTLGSSAEAVVKAVLEGNGGEGLAGEIAVDASASEPSASLKASAATEVVLEGNFAAGTAYCFVVAPAALSEGLSLSLYDESGKVWRKRGASAVTLSAGHVLNLGTLEPDGFVPETGYELEGDTYHVYGPDGLAAWASDPSVLTRDVVLETDIDMSGAGWVPVGTGMDSGYAGDFDGNGKTIGGLTVTADGNAGFFGALAAGGKVHDLRFSEAQVTGTGNSFAGVVAGSSLGIIEDCDVVASEVSGQYAGAVTGNNSVQVNRCDAVGVSVTGAFSAGGIAGMSYGKIEYCTLSGESRIVASGGSSRAGGIVGSTSEEGGVTTSGRVLKCAVEGAFISGLWAGGIAGENSFGIVAQCVVDGTSVSHDASYRSGRLGGVVGYSSRGDVVACYSAYSRIGDDGLVSEAMGGIVGYNYNGSAYVYGCYSTHVSLSGEVGGAESGKGSIAGYTNGHVTSCYAILPEGVSGISLVGRSAVYAPDHCVESGNGDYGALVSEVPDLTASDGSVWSAEEIWDMTASGAPSIVADYVCEPPAAISATAYFIYH